MRRSLDEVQELVRSRICEMCAVRRLSCESQSPGRCVLRDLLPLVVQAVLATDSPRLEDYREAIRENVCGICIDAALDGSCELRSQGRCALDLYLAEVVDIIRQAALT